MRNKVKSFVSFLIIPLVVWIVSASAISYLENNKVKIVWEYGQSMPWDSILTTHDSKWSVGLNSMVNNWRTSIPPALKDNFGINDLLSPDWSHWKVVNDARVSLERYDGTLFVDEKLLLSECDKAAKNRQPHLKLVVAITPERQWTDFVRRLNTVRDLVETYVKAHPDEFGGIPEVVTFPEALNPDKPIAYEDVIKGLAGGSIDFAFCSPYSTYLANNRVISKAASDSDNRVQMLGETVKQEGGNKVFLLRSNGLGLDPMRPIDTYKFVYSSRYSTSGYLIPLKMLEGMGSKIEEHYKGELQQQKVGNHESTMDYIQKRDDCVAGVPNDRLIERQSRISSECWLGAGIGTAFSFLICLFIGWIRYKRMSRASDQSRSRTAPTTPVTSGGPR